MYLPYESGLIVVSILEDSCSITSQRMTDATGKKTNVQMIFQEGCVCLAETCVLVLKHEGKQPTNVHLFLPKEVNMSKSNERVLSAMVTEGKTLGGHISFHCWEKWLRLRNIHILLVIYGENFKYESKPQI